MIHGIGAPKFYVYDSTRTTLQTIPTNLGSSGSITLSKRVVLTEHEPEWVGIQHSDMPYTHESMEEFLGYRYSATITCRQEDYTGGLLQYVANQANTNVTDIYKMAAIQAYSDAGYEIKFTPHADTEDLWNSPFPIWARPKIISMSRGGRIYSDIFVMQITGTQLIESPFAFEAFSFETLNGVLNANQCLSFDSASSEYGTVTQFSCGTVQTISFVMDQATPSAGEYVLYGSTGGESKLAFDATNIYYSAGADVVQVAHGGMISGSKTFWDVVRTGASVSFYKNATQIGSTQTLSSGASVFYMSHFGSFAGSAGFLSAKVNHVRIAASALTASKLTQQYNFGYGNWPFGDITYYAVYEMDGTGGTAMTETDQSGNSRTLTLINTPTRTTW